MARIICRTPSTGKPIRATLVDVPDTFTDIIDVPDFSVPDPAERFPVRDPADSTRAILPGEVFFLTPLSAINKSETDRWIEVRLITENNETVRFAKLEVPAGDTAFIPLQGRSLFKRDSSGATGDTIEVRAEVADVFDVWISGEEKVSSDHVGIVNE